MAYQINMTRINAILQQNMLSIFLSLTHSLTPRASVKTVYFCCNWEDTGIKCMFLPLLSKHTAKQTLSSSHAKGNTEVVGWP